MHPEPRPTIIKPLKVKTTFPHFIKDRIGVQRRQPLRQSHTGSQLSGSWSTSFPGSSRHLVNPPSGRSRPEPLLLPAPEGRPGGRVEEVSAAGWNASGRGGPAWGGGDSRLEAGTAGQARAMPHFTVVPVDGPRRGDYDNLEGLSWVDYGERAEREDSDGEGAPGGGCGWDGEASARDSRLRTARADVHAGLHFSCSLRAQTDRRVFLVRDSRAKSSSTHPQLLPRGPRAGAADVAAREAG